MSDFRILELPVKECHVDGYIGKWYVEAQRMNPHIAVFLGVVGTIVCLGDDKNYDHLYFDTEDEAHLAACRYYSRHSEPYYPYIAEWKECMSTCAVTINVGTRAMEFI